MVIWGCTTLPLVFFESFFNKGLVSKSLARRHLASTATGRLFASPRLARLASMIASPLSPCLASLALPRLVRLASPRSPCLASRSLASRRLRARLPRSPCLLPRLGQPLATSASRCLRHAAFKNLRHRHARDSARRLSFPVAWLAPV